MEFWKTLRKRVCLTRLSALCCILASRYSPVHGWVKPTAKAHIIKEQKQRLVLNTERK